MDRIIKKRANYQRRKQRVRARVTGTASRPRLAVYRSVKRIYCQLIDDVAGVTVAATSDVALKATGTKSQRAKAVGKKIAELAQAKGVKQIVFDRAGRLYHGRVKAIADGAREAGLEF
ncbi:MAG: 50S ribosomal protein L18 [Candidatus Kerfeldbacteria bacterium]|nr:50S ribosomal protein L18 [Candidatus Kerfeldbacteria bacterium]